MNTQRPILANTLESFRATIKKVEKPSNSETKPVIILCTTNDKRYQYYALSFWNVKLIEKGYLDSPAGHDEFIELY